MFNSIAQSAIAQKMWAFVGIVAGFFAPAWLYIGIVSFLIAVDTVLGILASRKRRDAAETPEERAKYEFRYSRMMRGTLTKAVGYILFLLAVTAVEVVYFNRSPFETMHNLPIVYVASFLIGLVEFVSISENVKFLYDIDFLGFLKGFLGVFDKDKAQLLEKLEEAAKAAHTPKP